ncbi:hypothetical protein [Streptomyces erythrochromogenes]|uniref:hypothetical protein n=1 Tax=Streptomyces erythrochromogenes TaxID=285574 RepID=UPI00344785EF
MYEYRDENGTRLTASPIVSSDSDRYVRLTITECCAASVDINVDHIEEAIAGQRDAARQTGPRASEEQAAAQEPDFGPSPRRFHMYRHTDVSGVSGTGVVADGVLWPDGTASVRWRGDHPSVVFWDRGQVSVDHVHGHGGATEIVWLDGAQASKPAAYTLHFDTAPLADTIRNIARRGPGEAGMTL